jgi:hypothetical protein
VSIRSAFVSAWSAARSRSSPTERCCRLGSAP